MKKLFLIPVLLLLFLFTASAQEFTISGNVVDASSKKPLADVQIFNKSTKKGTVTNSSGEFTISFTKNEKVQLVFSKLSFETVEQEISEKDIGLEITISLFPKSEQLEEVEITGISSKNHAYRTEYVGIKQLEQTNKQDIGDLLRNVPNVSGVKKGAMGIDPVIRGFKYSQLNVQLNGGTKMEGGCPNRMDPATAHVDISDVKNIVVLKGPFALK
ncbi:MAG TPA: carboxypeptidase-like regulatory domain-containing protein, partial [Bacteroidales bacterium]